MLNRIDQIWGGLDAWPELLNAMRHAMYDDVKVGASRTDLAGWVDLPGLCCQAAGGHPEWADDLTVVWLLYYAAADLMDKVQDQDDPDPWWQDIGSGAALSAATGLFFCASFALHKFADNPKTKDAVKEIITQFYNDFMVMTSGQYCELIVTDPTLEQYWKNIGAKSGKFFSMISRSAARLATNNRQRLDDFERYGFHLGVLLQIRDDLEDVRPKAGFSAYGQRREITRSLPVIYARSVLPPTDLEHLNRSLELASKEESSAREVIRLLDKSNTALYLVTEIERHRQIALDAIRRAVAPSQALDQLESYLHAL